MYKDTEVLYRHKDQTVRELQEADDINLEDETCVSKTSNPTERRKEAFHNRFHVCVTLALCFLV